MNRGLKNNNPGNIRLSASHWKGQIKGKDREFCTFSSMMYGVRALICLLRTYRYKYGLWTIEKILSRFAPSSENDTGLYINYVSKCLNFPSDTVLYLDWYDYTNSSSLYRLCASICKMETNFVLPHDLFLQALLSSDPLIASDYALFKGKMNNVLSSTTY